MEKQIQWNKIISLFRDKGIIFAILIFSTKYKIQLPSSASQGKISVGVTELIILFCAVYLLYLLLKKEYILRGIAKKIFNICWISIMISISVCSIHVIIQGKSIVEFVGVLRNLYACVLIYFLADAEKIRKEEIVNGIALFIVFMTFVTFYNSLAIKSTLELPDYSYSDSRYLTAAGSIWLPYVAYRNREDKFSMVLLYIDWIFLLPSILLVGSRAVWIVTVCMLFGAFVCMFVKRAWKNIKHMMISLVAGMTMICMLMSTIGTPTMLVSIFRASNIIQTVYVYGSGLGKAYKAVDEQEILESAVLPTDINSTDSVLQTAVTAEGSGKRSDSVRSMAWKLFGQKIAQHPIIGFGERFVETEGQGAYVQKINAHNFLIEIAALMGIVGILAYLILLIFVYVYIMFKMKIGWLEKTIVIFFSAAIYTFAMVQPVITGGITCDIFVWSIISFALLGD